jgi:hypothetical protein
VGRNSCWPARGRKAGLGSQGEGGSWVSAFSSLLFVVGEATVSIRLRIKAQLLMNQGTIVGALLD